MIEVARELAVEENEFRKMGRGDNNNDKNKQAKETATYTQRRLVNLSGFGVSTRWRARLLPLAVCAKPQHA